MMSISKYEIFKCDTCHRKISKETDQIRPSITRCNITYKCTGTLEKIDESNAKSTFSQNIDGLVNWTDRFSNISDVIQKTNNIFSVLSGNSAISLAVLDSVANGLLDQFSISLTSKKIDKIDFNEFLYIRGSNTGLVFGPDDSSGSITLRFSSLDSIKIYINGVEINSSLYVLNNTSDSIEFIPQLTQDNNTIRIVVFKQTAIQNRVINFSSSVNTDTAWGNISNIRLFNSSIGLEEQYTIYTSTNINYLEINDILEFQEFDNVYLLLSKYPFSNFDRILDSVIKINDISENSTNPIEINYKINDAGTLELLIESENGFGIVPYIKLQYHPNSPDIITTSISTNIKKSTNILLN